MEERKQDLWIHLLLVWLQTVGTALPLCALSGLSGFLPYAIVTVSVLLPLLELSRLNKWTFRSGIVLLALALALFLFAGQGLTLLRDLAIGYSLQLRDIPASLVLFGKEAVLLIGVCIAVIVFYTSTANFGAFVSLFFSVLAFTLLLRSNRADLLWLFTPAIVATVLFLLKATKPEIPQLRLILPITAVILVALLITPFSGVTYEPLKEAADELRQAVNDQFFFTDARNVFSLADEGYYPEGPGQLGGKVEISNAQVMEVSASETLYLRGISYDRYNGRNWTQSGGGRRYPWFSRSWEELRQDTFCMNYPLSETVTNYFAPVSFSVRILNEKASTLFVPQALRELRPGGNLSPYFNTSSEVFITRNLQPGDTYSGTAYSFISGEPGLGTLIEACEKIYDPAYSKIRSDCTVLPDHLESQVYELAAKLTEGFDTPYEKAFAIQNWLTRNYTYTLDVEDQPEDLDFVTNFLFNTKEGYCMYFASAMTVLSRIMGLPARFVGGYVFRPGQEGNAILTGLDAHAWCEIYFSGFGWVTFDATPSSNNHAGDRSAPEPTPTPTPTPEPTPDQDPDGGNADLTPPPGENEPTPPPPTEEPKDTPVPPEASEDPSFLPEKDQKRSSGLLLWILLLLALLGIIAARILLTDPHSLESKAKDDPERMRIFTQYLYDLLHISGLDPRKGETPMGFMKRCDRSGLTPVSVAKAGACVSVICYAHYVPEGEDILLVRNTADQYFRKLPPRDQARYMLYRSFVPLESRRFDPHTLTSSSTEEHRNVKLTALKTRIRLRNHPSPDPDSKPSERV